MSYTDNGLRVYESLDRLFKRFCKNHELPSYSIDAPETLPAGSVAAIYVGNLYMETQYAREPK